MWNPFKAAKERHARIAAAAEQLVDQHGDEAFWKAEASMHEEGLDRAERAFRQDVFHEVARRTRGAPTGSIPRPAISSRS